MEKVTRQCPQTTTFLMRKENRSGIEPRSFRLPAYRLTAAMPNRLTTSTETIRLIKDGKKGGGGRGMEVGEEGATSVLRRCCFNCSAE